MNTCSCSALRQASRHLSRFYDAALAPCGLGINQYSILSRLDRLGPLNLNALAAELVMDRSTLGHLLRPLAARALVTMEPDAQDRRVRLIALSTTGATTLAQARPLWAQAERHFAASFGPDAATTLRNTLQQISTLPLY